LYAQLNRSTVFVGWQVYKFQRFYWALSDVSVELERDWRELWLSIILHVAGTGGTLQD
jgi:hypothetical protein